MSIALIVTRGFGNGTLTGSIADIVLAGFSIESEGTTALPVRGVVFTTQEAFTLLNKTTGAIITDPSIASGDFKISKDGGAFVNLATLPAVSPSGSPSVFAVYSATEMTSSVIVVWGVDQSSVWADVFFSFQVPNATAETIEAIISSTGVTLSSDQMNAISDHVLRRALASARASSDGDTVSGRSLLGSASTVVNRVSATDVPGKLTIYEENDSTVFVSRAIVTDAEAKLITEIDPD